MIDVLITDDYPVVRQGLKMTLGLCPHIGTIDEAGNSKEMLSKIAKHDFQVLLLDILMPGRSGIAVLKEIKTLKPDLAVLMISSFSEEEYAVKSIRLGASGYITKSSPSEELIKAVMKVAAGKNYISPSLTDNISFYLDNKNQKEAHSILSEREMSVMRFMAKGKTIKDIAMELSLSPKTISTYRERIIIKMGLKSTAAIIRYAIKNGLAD